MKNKNTHSNTERKNRMKYGNTVDLFPLLNTNDAIFIPKLFSWEPEATKAIVTVCNKEIICNLGSKLLIKTDGLIREVSIPFEINEKGEYTCKLRHALREKKIKYEKGTGIYCDETCYSQERSSSEVLYCKDAIIEHSESPYWGLQYELYIVNEQMRPKAGGRTVKIIRFNECDPQKKTEIEKWMFNVLRKKRTLEAYDLEKALREFVKGSAFVCAMFCQVYGDKYDWVYYQPEKTEE
ncbi:MAG: hypothetical protein IKO61_03455 [Lachnospiraceae bacterium]|nr:hypothetical protein [Lachnospiraceae bacterium]